MVVTRPFRSRSVLAALAAIAALGLATPRSAAAEDVLIQSGIDSSPYSFIPSLPRGLRDTQYAFSGEDESGFSHDFRTFVRFDLPPDLLGPDETVLEAYVWVYYSFDFTGFGDSSEVAGELHCYEVLEPWEELSLTWTNQPSYGPAFDVHPHIEGLGLLWCDATDAVRRWATGESPNHGFAFTNPTERLIGLYSFEASQVDPNFRPSLVVSTGPSNAFDFDSDGAPDASDNCPETTNPGQADGNGDGIGDACAFAVADLNTDGLVNWHDVLVLTDALGRSEGEPGYDPACDLNGDGVIDAADEALYDSVYQECFTGGATCGLIGLEVLFAAALARLRRRGMRP